MDSEMCFEGDGNNFTNNLRATNFDSTTRALTNEVILENIFAFLNSESFKCCRMVCMLWKTVGQVLFKKKFRICFNFKSYKKEGTENLTSTPVPSDLRSFFQNAQQEIPFEAMKLKGYVLWTPPVLTEFFESEGRFITDLILEDVSLAVIGRRGLRSKKENRYYKKFDFATILGELITLKRLTIAGYKNTTNFQLTLNLLSNIETIDLENCEIELSEHILKPIALRLASVRFYRKNQLVENILINDFVDLSYLTRKLCLDATPSNNLRPTKLKVDFCGTCKLDNIFLVQVEVLNLKESLWTIDGATHFIDVLIQEKINLTTKRLNMIEGSCDLHWLPESCVDVHLDKCQLQDGILQRGFTLKNVKCLHLRDLEFAKCILPNLKSVFINLVELHLDFTVLGDVNVEITNLPPTLSKLFINDDSLKFIGDDIKTLDVLSLKCGNLESVEILLNHFIPENLIVFINFPNPTNNENFLAKLAKNSLGKMIVGIFGDNYITSPCTTDKSPFPSVEIVGELYAFIDGKGGFIKWKSYLRARQYLCNGEIIEIE